MGCSLSTDTDYKRAVAGSEYKGDVVCERDRIAFVLDWDDTLFPSTWLKENLKVPRDRLRARPAVKAHYRRLLAFLTTATLYGHVFIVTAANCGFVQKSCALLFPDLFQKLEELGVSILHSRPPGIDEPAAEDKAMMFSFALAHQRPIPPALARFYEQDLVRPGSKATFATADNWAHVFSIGDAAEDLLALKTELLHHPCCVKLIKFKDDPALEELSQELSVLNKYLPTMVGLDRFFSLTMEKPLDVQLYPMCERMDELTLSFNHIVPSPQQDLKRIFPSPDSQSTLAPSSDLEDDAMSVQEL
jgi:hypothetical protein